MHFLYTAGIGNYEKLAIIDHDKIDGYWGDNWILNKLWTKKIRPTFFRSMNGQRRKSYSNGTLILLAEYTFNTVYKHIHSK